jgi:hypothetical protein
MSDCEMDFRSKSNSSELMKTILPSSSNVFQEVNFINLVHWTPLYRITFGQTITDPISRMITISE